jgi:hypothetical protein
MISAGVESDDDDGDGGIDRVFERPPKAPKNATQEKSESSNGFAALASAVAATGAAMTTAMQNMAPQ